MQLFICAQSPLGHLRFGGSSYHLIASDGTVFSSHGCSCPSFAFHDVIADLPGLRSRLSALYGRGNWKVMFLWDQVDVSFSDLDKLVRQKNKTSISNIFCKNSYKRSKNNINTILAPDFGPVLGKKKRIRKPDRSWWNGKEHW